VSQGHESFGKYILLERLAMGGMAEIYLARSMAAAGVSKFFAIKRILPQFSEQIEFIDMFKDEAKIAVNLSHANIVSIYEFGVEKSQFYLAMDYVEGRNLRQILNKMKKSGVTFSIEQVIFIIKETAAGLDAAHRCIDAQTGKPLNIIHRDMSPQNVMVSFEGEVKVVDFGIAKAETQIETTRAGTLKGKFGYMSPEQAEGQSIDLRTDIFALGIVFWELLANDRLFVANNEVNTLRKIRDCQIPSLRKINPNIPQELERIVSKALAKDRNLRYQTGAAFQRDLSKFLNRQYPDFSPHDFSVFIKTLFAGEILESRKKMIEYAKVDTKMVTAPAQISAPQQPVYDHTVVTATNSITESTGGLGKAHDLAPAPPPSTPQSSPPSPRLEPRIEAKPDQRAEPRGDAVRPRPSFNAPPTPSPKALPAAPTPSQQSRERSPASTSRESKESREAKDADFNLSVDRTVFRDRTQYTDSNSGSSYYSGGTRANYSRTNIRVQKSSALPIRALLIVAALLGGGAYAYMHYGPETLQWQAQNLLSQVAKAIGRKPVESSPLNQTHQSSTDVTTYPIAVTSNPPGAEILIDEKTHADVTPTTLRLEEGREVKLTMRMPGYIAFNELFKVTGSRQVHGILRSERRGRLYVNVVGAGQVLIDGKRETVAPGQPFLVPADREILVSTFDPSTGTGDETRVIVAEGQTRKITLIPRPNYKAR
jgi:serine/threonine protein kinase